jgi:hypothetical protein
MERSFQMMSENIQAMIQIVIVWVTAPFNLIIGFHLFCGASRLPFQGINYNKDITLVTEDGGIKCLRNFCNHI